MGSAVDLARLEAELEGMGEAERLAFVRGLGKGDMVRLWDACVGRQCVLEHFVPASVPDGVEVIHAGKNSLPLFSSFQKRFTRAPEQEGREGAAYGYNHTGLNFTTAGPGYFIAYHHDDERGEFGVNYYDVPPKDAALPAGWPKVRRNEFGLQRFIYAKMIDYMRLITDGVTIGRAWRHGKITNNYFVLCRTGV